MRKITMLGTVVVLAAILGGCATKSPQAAAKAKAVEDEYIWYTPTGSHLPIRIRKSDLVDRENTRADQEAMRDATRRGLHMDRSGD